MDNSPQWPQGFGGGVVKAGVDHHNPTSSSPGSIDQQKRSSSSSILARPQKDLIVNCPRCNSVNTKFCYYNNYSLSQPRYFCKTCRRYWTAGGSLRNVPVGGGSRKNRKSSSSISSLTAAQQAQAQTTTSLIHQAHDLNLSFPPPHLKPPPHDDPNMTNPTFTTKPNFSIAPSSGSELLSHHLTPLLPPMGLFKNSTLGSLMMNHPQHHHTTTASSIFTSAGFPQMHHHQDQFKPSSLNFSLDGFAENDGYASSLQLGNSSDDGSNASARRLLSPFNQDHQNLENKDQHQKQQEVLSSDVQFDHSQTRTSPSSVQGGGGADGSSTAGFWTGMLSGGSW